MRAQSSFVVRKTLLIALLLFAARGGEASTKLKIVGLS